MDAGYNSWEIGGGRTAWSREKRSQGVTDHPHSHQQHGPPLLLTVKPHTPTKSQSHNYNMPDRNAADATCVPVPCCCRARAALQPPRCQAQVQQQPCHLPTGSPPAPALQQAQVKHPAWQMAISMATQGCHGRGLSCTGRGSGAMGREVHKQAPDRDAEQERGARQRFSRPSSPFSSSLA